MAIIGSSLGFLVLNKYPACILAGNIGSSVLGYMVGYLLLIMGLKSNLFIPLIIVNYIMISTACAIIYHVRTNQILNVSSICKLIMTLNYNNRLYVFSCVVLIGIINSVMALYAIGQDINFAPRLLLIITIINFVFIYKMYMNAINKTKLSDHKT